tara:strand:+ start:34 stop:252 length:219 start_codon:yes stop_codon:yes gene_type:complete
VNKNLEWLIIIFLVVILVNLSACATPKASAPTKQPEVPVANMEVIANVLGCVFDPTPCQDKKDLAKTEEGKQ